MCTIPRELKEERESGNAKIPAVVDAFSQTVSPQPANEIKSKRIRLVYYTDEILKTWPRLLVADGISVIRNFFFFFTFFCTYNILDSRSEIEMTKCDFFFV